MNNTSSVNGRPESGNFPNADEAGQTIPTSRTEKKTTEKGLNVEPNRKEDSPGFAILLDFLPPGVRSIKIDPTLVMSVLTEVFNKLDEKQIAAFTQQLKNEQPRFQKILEARLKQIDEKVKKQAEVNKQQKNTQVASDAQLGLSVALMVVGLIATILTAGALSGVMIAGMAIGGVTTTLDVTTRILKAADQNYIDPNDKKTKKPIDVSIAGLVKIAMDYDFARENSSAYPARLKNASPEEKAKYREAASLAASIVVMLIVAGVGIGLGVGGIMAAKKMAEGAKDAGNIVRKISEKVADFAEANVATIQAVAQGVDVAGDLANLSSAGYQAGNTITMGNNTFDMRMAEAELNRLDSYSDVSKAHLSRIQAGMQNSSKSIGEVKKNFADTRAMLNENMSNIISAA